MRDKLPTISFDIDGVINNYPLCFINYVNSLLKTDFVSNDEIKKLEDYKYLKHSYRLSDYKYNVDVYDEIKKLISEIYREFQIKIFTSRPFHNYGDMFKNTKLWLEKNNIKFDGLFSKNFEIFDKANVLIHIDDEINHIKPLLDSKKTQFIVLEEGLDDFNNVHFVKNKIYIKDKIHQILNTIL